MINNEKKNFALNRKIFNLKNDNNKLSFNLNEIIKKFLSLQCEPILEDLIRLSLKISKDKKERDYRLFFSDVQKNYLMKIDKLNYESNLFNEKIIQIGDSSNELKIKVFNLIDILKNKLSNETIEITLREIFKKTNYDFFADSLLFKTKDALIRNKHNQNDFIQEINNYTKIILNNFFDLQKNIEFLEITLKQKNSNQIEEKNILQIKINSEKIDLKIVLKQIENLATSKFRKDNLRR